MFILKTKCFVCLLSKNANLFQWLYWLVWLSFISAFSFELGNVSENFRLFNLVLIERFVDTEEQTSMCYCHLIWCPLLFWMTCIFLHAAWSQGDPRKVIYPTDSRGQFCGQAGTPLEWVTWQYEHDVNTIYVFENLSHADYWHLPIIQNK